MRTHLVFAGLFVVACSGPSTTRTVSGRIAPGFPDSITKVKVMQGSNVVAVGMVSADGRFSLAVPQGSGYTMRFVGAGHSNLLMPRRSGGMQHVFMLGAGGDISLGGIHYIGNASTTRFSFHSSPETECDEEDHDTTGAMCVDDQEGNDECDGDTDDDGDHMGSGSGSGSGSGMGSGSSHDDFTGTTEPNTSGMSDDDGNDDGDCAPDHDMDEGCNMGSGSGGSGSGGSGSGGTGSGGTGSGSGGTGSGSGSGTV
jgi:hypothetical protein